MDEPDRPDRQYAVGLFLAGLRQLRVDDESCAVSDFDDVQAVALTCAGLRIALADATDAESLELRQLATATKQVLVTYSVVDNIRNPVIVRLWRAAYDEYRDCRPGGLECN